MGYGLHSLVHLESLEKILISMGMLWNLNITFLNPCPITSEVLEENVQSILNKYDDTFSDWSTTSELRQLETEFSSREKIKATDLFLEALGYAELLHNLSHKAFDITMGDKLWLGKPHVGQDNLYLFNDGFLFKNPPLRLTFNGFVKGMALGELGFYLKNLGASAFFINAGGGDLLYFNPNQLDKTMLESIKKGPLLKDYFYFLSFSYQMTLEDKPKLHVFSSSDASLSHAAILCEYHPDSLIESKKIGALTDGLATSLSIEPKTEILPQCYVKSKINRI